MSCYACGSSFGLFSKEHGCKNCGYAFCGKCLTKKTAVPKLQNEKHHVCNKCFNILTGKVKETANPARYSPPENFKKRVAALKEREEQSGHSRTSGTTAPSGGKSNPQYRGLSKAEREIAERLDKLKEKSPAEAAKYNVTQKEIEDRFAKLKGEEPSRSQSQPKQFYHAPDRRSQQTQIDDLLDEIADEVELDSKLPDPVKEIERRLLQLKGDQNGARSQSSNDLNIDKSNSLQPFTQNISQGKGGDKCTTSGDDSEISYEEMQKLIAQAAQEAEMDAEKAMTELQKDKNIMKRLQEIKSHRKEDINQDKNTGDKDEDMKDESDSDNENEEELTKNLIKQLLEESRMEEAAARDGIKKNNEDTQQVIDSDELPYCSICTEDAALRCHGCDLDLFCKRCWNHCHKEYGMDDHVTSKYIKPKDLG